MYHGWLPKLLHWIEEFRKKKITGEHTIVQNICNAEKAVKEGNL